ncbi:MAG: GNAT family N-acetyltransferase [Lentilitoribacter sp.]|uniref:GNAT family N-acetyltransferase n=1 Tax=Tateyamaria sp. TaxID=1929288 RepID=UPI003273D7DD
MRVETLTGAALSEALDDIARLRMAVFRDWPYLYEGTMENEHRYLQAYQVSERAIALAVYDGDWLVGASTGAPLSEHAEDFGEAFEGTPFDVEKIFYCGESVLLPRYRGQGIGHQFFEAREDYARGLGFEKICFSSVVRPPDHPLKPSDYRALDPFWKKRGYDRLPGVVAQFTWKDVDQVSETAKPLQMWMRDL